MTTSNEIRNVQSFPSDVGHDISTSTQANGRDITHADHSMPSLLPWGDLPRLEMLPFVPAEARRVLDVGCNLGRFGEAIKNRAKTEVWGVEPDALSAMEASKVLDQVLAGFFTDDLLLPDRYFDAIVFNDVLEHMADPWAALKLAREKLAKDGRVVVSIPNLRYIENLIHIFKERDFKYELNGIRDRTHLRFFTKKSALRLFEGSGLEVVELQGINEEWWTPSIFRRLSFRLFKGYLEDTRHVQFAIVAKEGYSPLHTTLPMV